MEADPQLKDDLIRARGRYDIGFFAKWCWPDVFGLPWNAFHRDVLGRVDPPWHERTANTFRVTAAPRGIAKTTTAKAIVAHALVYGLDRVALVVSAEQGLAESISKHIRSWFDDETGELWRLFGPFEVRGGVKQWQGAGPGLPLFGLIAKSFNSQVRGCNIDAIRPTRMVVDDGERPDRVRSADQRNLWHRFLQDDIIKAGPNKPQLVLDWNGTVLHSDAVLARLLKAAAWVGKKYQAIVSWPDRTDLWDRARRIYLDLELGDEPVRRACVRAFYESNREEMDAGAKVLDEVAAPLFNLYLEIWSNGLRSFMRERQNDPRNPDDQLFVSERFRRFDLVERHGELVIVTVADEQGRRREVKLSETRRYLRWDPSMGGSGSDYAAVACVARDRLGYTYVLAVWMRRARPTGQLAAVWAEAERFSIQRGSLESNGFQKLLDNEFRRQRAKREAEGRFFQLALELDPSTTNKEDRIAGLEVSAANGWLLFNSAIPQPVLAQFDDFPNGDHDDGPDAVEGGVARIGGRGPHMVNQEGVR